MGRQAVELVVLWLVRDDSSKDTIFGLRGEGRTSSQENECDDAHGPHINLVVILFLFTQLRCHVKWTTE